MGSRARRTISGPVAAFLEEKRIISPVTGEKRKISPLLITPPTTPPESIRSSSGSLQNLISARDFSAASRHIETDSIEIPEHLYSPEALEFIGFNRPTANKLWEQYIDHSADLEDADLMDFVKWHVELARASNPDGSQDDWTGYLNRLGINETLEAAILMPEFKDIRYTASGEFWILEALEGSFHVIKNLDETATAEFHRLQGQQESANINKGKDVSEKDAPKPEVADAVAAPLSLPGHTMLWRAGCSEQCNLLCNKETQRLNVGAIATQPGDFNGRTAVGYFSPQKETANRYAEWLKHKVPTDDLRIVQIAVPETFIRTLAVKHLFWSGNEEHPGTNEWRKVIFASRKGNRLPSELKYIHGKDLLIGHIARGIQAKFASMKDHTEIKEFHVLTVVIDGGERKAIQWTFLDEAEERFEDATQGKVWVHRLGALKVLREKTD